MIGPTRRTLLGGIASVGMASVRLAKADDIGSLGGANARLRDLGEARNIIFGAAAVSDVLRNDPAMATMYVQEAGMIVADYEMKWGEVRPTPTTFSFAGADYLANFADKNGLQMRGHCLVWEESNPPWLKTVLTPNNAEHFLVEHIERVVDRYAGRIHSWDVVNEPIWPDHEKPDGLRNGVWLENIGPKYIDIAFRTARAADPKALLVLNDAGTEITSKSSRTRRAYFLKLIDGLKDRGVPLDAIGLECHLSTRLPFVADDFSEYLAAIASRGLKILLTELDVSDADEPSSDIAVRDRAVADMYEKVVASAVRNNSVIAVLTWELSDKYSWLRDPSLGANLRRPDRLPMRPLPYDDALQRKACWWSVARALSGDH